MNDFVGLFAIVTGGATGIGAATAAMLQNRDAQVTVLDRQEPVNPTAGITYVLCDIRNRSDVDRCVKQSAMAIGGIDIVVNNAGVGSTGDASVGDDEECHRVLDINVVGTGRLSAASKGAVYSLTLSIAADHVRERIRVNCVLPGTADTPWVAQPLANSSDPTEMEKTLIAR